MQPFETYQHEGVTVELHYDDDSSFANPREYDNVTTMVCWHPDYILGDYQVKNPEGRGAVGQIFETDRGRTDFSSMNVLHRYLSLVVGAKRITPLYLYDHSGFSMSAGSPNVFDTGGWDTTMVGFAYITEEKLTECCGDGDECRTDEWIDKAIRDDVSTYDLYLTGQVYGYVVDPDGPDEESCWGYLGDESVREEANMVAAHVAKARRAPDRIYVDAAPVEEALYALSH